MSVFTRAAACAWALACIVGTAAPAFAKFPELRYGLASTTLTYAPIYVAEDAGFFKKEGVDVKGELMSGSGVEAAATIAGNLPFYVGLPQTAALAIAKGQGLKTFAEISDQYPLDVVVSKSVAQRLHLSRKTPVGEQLDALKGLRIAGWTPGGGPDMLIRFIMAKKGWGEKDLTVLPIGPAAAMIAALQNGRIDGFVFSSPSSDEAVSRLGAFIVYRGASAVWAPLHDEPFNCLIGNTKWLAEHQDEAVAVYRGLALAMIYMREHPAATKALLRKRLSMFSDADFEASYANLHFMIPDSPAVGPAQAGKIEDFMKTLDPSFSLPGAKVIDADIGALARARAAH